MDFIDEYVDDYTIWEEAVEEEPEDTGKDSKDADDTGTGDSGDDLGGDPASPDPLGFCGTESAAGVFAAGVAALLAAGRRRR